MSYLTTTDNINLFYEKHGEGETLIFCHGLNSSHNVNFDFYNEFRDDYQVVLYDQCGHGDSDRATGHMNVKRLGQDLNDIIESLDLDDVTVIGHSMGAATIYSYVDQFGCDKLKRIVSSDMSPYMRNDGWKGGIAQGKWSDEDFMEDFDRIFDDVGYAAYYITKNIMDPRLSSITKEEEYELIKQYGKATDAFTMASFRYSLFRSDQRPAIDKITVPFMYIMPDYPLYSMDAVDYLRNHVKSDFVLENDFSNTTHAIWRQMPHEVACAIKDFINNF